jgi:acylphosphatase
MGDGSDGRYDVRGYRVEGRVQGVGFRWWARKTALALGLRGRVRNMADGSVEVRATGPSDALDRLAAELGHGPPPANVARVERLVGDAGLREEAATWTSFQIDRG